MAGVVFFVRYFSNTRKSKYQPRPVTCLARSSTRSLTEANARPGGKANAFCEEVRQMSRPHSSTGIQSPARLLTASTKSKRVRVFLAQQGSDLAHRAGGAGAGLVVDDRDGIPFAAGERCVNSLRQHGLAPRHVEFDGLLAAAGRSPRASAGQRRR